MSKRRHTVGIAPLREPAFMAARASFGTDLPSVATLLARSRAFEVWLSPYGLVGPFACRNARQALTLAVEDITPRRGRQPLDTRAILRRAEAYRAFLGSV